VKTIGWLAISALMASRALGQLPATYACLPGTPHHGTISGTVTRAESGVAAANVMVELQDSARVCRARTDLHGRFSFQPGRSTWQLIISNPGDQQFVRNGLRIGGGDKIIVNPRLRPLVLTLEECALLSRCSDLLATERHDALNRDDALRVAAARTGIALADVRHHPDWQVCTSWDAIDPQRAARLDAVLAAAIPPASATPACRFAATGNSTPVVVRLSVSREGRADSAMTLRLRAGPEWIERWTCRFSQSAAGWQAQACRRASDPSARE
jgi:hypothetical protein